MRSIGFVGKIDKTELVQYVAKVLSTMGNKTIVIDATTTQKTRYSVPVIPGTEGQSQYVIEHDSVDIAVGFNNILELKKYLISKGEDFNEYEYVIADIDSDDMCEEYDLKNANNLFFVTSFDRMHVSKGIDLLRFICATKRRENPDARVDLTKVLFYSELNTANAKYIDSLTDNLPLNWLGNVINIPYNGTDISANIQNQYSTKLNFRYLSPDLKEGIMNIVNCITGEDMKKLRKTVKNIENIARFSI